MSNYNPDTPNSEFPIAYRLEAVRLYAELGRYKTVLEEMAKRHPGRTPPMQRTLKGWVTKYEAVASKAKFVSGEPRELWLEVELAALDKLLNTINSGEVATNVLYAIAGVAADKRLRALELDKGKTTNVRHFHELVTARRNQLIAAAQQTLDISTDEAEGVVELQEGYTPMLAPPSQPVHIDLEKVVRAGTRKN